MPQHDKDAPGNPFTDEDAPGNPFVDDGGAGGAFGVPADGGHGGPRPLRRQVGDDGDLQPRRRRHLGEEHRAELAGADQPGADRAAAGGLRLELEEEVHSLSFSTPRRRSQVSAGFRPKAATSRRRNYRAGSGA